MPIKWVLHWQPNSGTTVNSQILAEVSHCVESINGVKEGKWKATLSFYRPVLKEQANVAEFPRDFLGISLPEQPSKYYFVLRGQRLVCEADSTIQAIMEKLQSYKTRVALNFEGFQYQLGDFHLRVGKVVPIHSESLRGIIMEGGFYGPNKQKELYTLAFDASRLQRYSRAAYEKSTIAFDAWGLPRSLLKQLLDIHPRVDHVAPGSMYQIGELLMEYRPISSWEKSHKIMGEFFDIWQEAMGKRSLPGHFVHMEPNFGEFGLSDQYSPQHTAVQYATIMLQMIATAQSVRN